MTMSVKERMRFVSNELKDTCAIMCRKPGMYAQIHGGICFSLMNMEPDLYWNKNEDARELLNCRYLRFIRNQEYNNPKNKAKLRRMGKLAKEVLDVVSAIMAEKGI